ncbi:MAG TPA: ankyrin repeat domain-containing protein [Saprospiraceae bacterium]|nr:ankyrin repeat domain-containing protein [Saprospiraceae bacterium]HNT19781.1 ankyrin repeat domain-containing protein [Saprospiraceae bacterium]
MKDLGSLITAIELHDVEGIRSSFARGISPNDLYQGIPLFRELTSEYTRSPRFSLCVKAFVDFGLKGEDPALVAVLLDDAPALEKLLAADGALIHKTYSMRCAYTPMHEVSLLHLCAEFNHVACADLLFRYGADINSAAGFDEFGFGGQTPVFHTVNQNSNQSADMLTFLLDRAAKLQVTVPGLIWGKGYEWETLIPAVNPISYAMMGLLPQMHRSETVIAETVSKLLRHAYGIKYEPANVPNAYLARP